MKVFNRRMVLPLILVAAFLASAAVPALAQGVNNDWEYDLTVYGWLPSLGGTLNFDVPDSDGLSVDPKQILDNLQFVVMGNFGVRKGQWGFFTDVIYLNEGNSKNGTVTAPIGPLGRMAEVGASMKLEAWIVAGMGTYTAMETEGGRLDFIFGVRYLQLDSKLSLNLQGFHPIPTPYQQHDFSISKNAIDAVVGIKGAVVLGGNWIMPYYLDAGAGDSKFTWQGVLGVGYQWESIDVSLGYRYLSYDLGSGNPVHTLTAGGPVMGLKFKW